MRKVLAIAALLVMMVSLSACPYLAAQGDFHRVTFEECLKVNCDDNPTHECCLGDGGDGGGPGGPGAGPGGGDGPSCSD